ncbi:hypothetical protein D3C78_1403170 [compost metagenome]
MTSTRIPPSGAMLRPALLVLLLAMLWGNLWVLLLMMQWPPVMNRWSRRFPVFPPQSMVSSVKVASWSLG